MRRHGAQRADPVSRGTGRRALAHRGRSPEPGGVVGAGGVVGVLGACGGVGASTFAALLAARVAQDGDRVALVDLDDTGGGLDVLLGLEGGPGVRWVDLRQVQGALEATDMTGVLPSWQGVEVLSGGARDGEHGPPRAAPAVVAALAAGCSWVVVDLPVRCVASAGDVLIPVLDLCSDLLLVTAQDVRGVAGALAARSALERAARTDLVPHGPTGALGPPGDASSSAARWPTRLVLRGSRRARVAPLEVAHVVDLPVVAVLPTEPRLAEAVDRGFGPMVRRRGALGRAVGRTVRGLAGEGR
ncbi:P-loop NTPase [Actinotalea sp. K2]|uniref:P-loop NTPase n=1 Tax=Actinotalea sp. K2 TaxID=2939438 RepID=UPI002017DF23|nr:P-loop NTPase [Actinotalea sp. K2]MCL3861368.1 P-loop NTPase [Actinotalea sp. K2]